MNPSKLFVQQSPGPSVNVSIRTLVICLYLLPIQLVAQSTIPLLEDVLDSCLKMKANDDSRGLTHEIIVTDIGAITVWKIVQNDQVQSCTVVAWSATENGYEIAATQDQLFVRIEFWMERATINFENARVLDSGHRGLVLLACVQKTWRIIAASQSIDTLANDDMRNDPRWLTDLAQAAAVNFMVKGPSGNQC